MSVNVRLDAAEGHFHREAAILSLVLNLRQRKTSLVKLRTGQWMTAERGASRKAFSKAVVEQALHEGLLTVQGVDQDGPSLLHLTHEGDKLALEILAWLKQQNAAPLTDRQKAEHMWAEVGRQPAVPMRFYPPEEAERLAKEAREIYDRKMLYPNLIDNGRKGKALEILAETLQQIGDEFLMETMYRRHDLQTQLRAGFEKRGLAFDDLHPDHQEQILEKARASLEETHGWVMDPDDRRD